MEKIKSMYDFPRYVYTPESVGASIFLSVYCSCLGVRRIRRFYLQASAREFGSKPDRFLSQTCATRFCSVDLTGSVHNDLFIYI